MKLSDWARQQGVAYKTAHKWFQKGLLPVPAQQLPSGTILVDLSLSKGTVQVALYAAVLIMDRNGLLRHENLGKKT